MKTCTALTCWASVIGLSTVTVSGTALPFSMSGGRSSFTLPGVTRADPTTLRMASCISAGVARAGATAMTDPSPRPAATPPAVFKKSRRDVGRSIQSLNVIKKATTSSICSALRTGLPRHAGATRTSPSDR